jgi:Glycosyl hydrolases family 35
MRALILAFALLSVSAAPPDSPPPQREYVQAVEFPYYLYPRQFWERELVWLQTVGITTVEFSIPWNWHEPEQGKFDFTGTTSPRRDLAGLIRTLRRLRMRAWIRPVAPVKGWLGGGVPAWAARDKRAQRQWTVEIERLLAPQLERHGGPVAFVDGALPWTDHTDAPPAPPQPVVLLSASDPAAMTRSRAALATGRGSLLWEDVEDAIYPAGWAAAGTSVFRRGAVSLNGDERPSVGALRRDASLLQHWAELIAPLDARPLAMKLPRGVTAIQLQGRTPASPSAVSVSNAATQPFTSEIHARDRSGKHVVTIPPITIAPGDSMWLPVEVPLAGSGLCKECSAFANGEYIAYATAELQTVEFENGILAMEFAAPRAAEVVLQLSRQPSGPYLAGGKPIDFEWDEKALRARLPIPAGKGAGSHVRIGLAIEAPETSAFFVDAKRLVIGQKNPISTSYSSAQLAARSRLRLPENFTATAKPKSPLEIDYELDVQREALHGSWVNLGIEADGVLLGRARVQLFRPLSVYLTDALKLHFGAEEELAIEPALVARDPKSARNLDITLRNNSPQIRSFVVEPQADGWEFMPPKTEISIGGAMERVVSLRAFSKGEETGLCEGRLKISGGAQMEVPLRIVNVPRGQTVAYSLDLDGDGTPDWVLESASVRAVFSTREGGRWMEFVWKDTGTNFLPELGALAGTGAVEVTKREGGLELAAGAWKRTVRLDGAALSVEQSTPLPAETLQDFKRDAVNLKVTRESAHRAVYSLAAEARK